MEHSPAASAATVSGRASDRRTTNWLCRNVWSSGRKRRQSIKRRTPHSSIVLGTLWLHYSHNIFVPSLINYPVTPLAFCVHMLKPRSSHSWSMINWPLHVWLIDPRNVSITKLFKSSSNSKSIHAALCSLSYWSSQTVIHQVLFSGHMKATIVYDIWKKQFEECEIRRFPLSY